MSDDRLGIGGNSPPADDYVQRLEGDIEDLLDLEADLELALAKVPKEVEDDDGVAATNAWVIRMRELARDLEARRTETKAPYLLREKQIDGFFGGIRARVLQKAKEVEQRGTAYLQAKQRRLQIEADARAAAKRREEQLAAEAAAAAKKKAEEAAAAAKAAEEDLTRTAARQVAPEKAAAAEAQLREATQAQIDATKEVEAADQSARQASLAADRAERRAADPVALAKTGGGGANARVVMIPGYRIDNVSILIQSLGPLNPYVDMKLINEALARWAKIAQNDTAARSAIPGVEWFEQPEVKTSGTRK